MRHHNKVIVRAVTAAQSIGFYEWTADEIAKMGYHPVSISAPGSEAERLAKNSKFEVITIDMKRHISPLRDLRSLWELYRSFRCLKPTMVHSMTPKAGLLCMIAAQMARIPVRVHTFTGLVFPTAKGLTRRILMLTDRITCACATHIIPEGEGVRADLLNNRITRKDIRVLGNGNINGIDLKHFDPNIPEVREQAAEIRQADKFTFVFVGRLVRDKGINELVQAFTRLNSEIPNTRLILVGPQEAELDPLNPETLAAIESNPAIKAVGSRKDVRPWYAAADTLVFPSYREGFPNVVIEAGAMSLPAIVTDINGSREIIIDGRNGIIIPSRDAEALYSTMHRMVTDCELRTQLAAEARPLIASRYEQSFVRQALLDFYRKILPER